MKQITINFDDKNYYIICPRNQKLKIESSSNRIRITDDSEGEGRYEKMGGDKV